jgi:integrase
MEKITFILLKTKTEDIGMINEMIHQGSKVISRKSMKIKIPYKSWDSNLKRVKKSHPDYLLINQSIEKRIKEFEKISHKIPDGDDQQCVLNYIKKLNQKEKEDFLRPISTTLKYETIIKNFDFVIKKILRLETLPFGKLREKNFVENLKMQLRKQNNGTDRLKKNKTWFNYMSVFGSFVNNWNINSGTQFPINTRFFTANIPGDDKKLATVLTREELCKLEAYIPHGYKKGIPQLLAKNIFLFQYYTGGIRIQDALTLTNKQVKSNGIEIKIKKSKRTQLFGFCYEQVDCLKTYYPEEYNNAIEMCSVGSLNISAETIYQLNRLKGLGEIKEFNLEQLQKSKNVIIKKSKLQPELSQFIQPFNEVINILKNEISSYFFNAIRTKPQNFLFPKLDWDELKNVFGENNQNPINEKQAYLIHRATTSHNSNLKRISKQIGTDVMGGHTPRHSIANHLYNDESNSVSDIQAILLHSNEKLTKIYLRERHGNPKVNETLKHSHDKMRKIKEEIEKREI